MSSERPTTPGAVFLSYAREDAEAARRIADALRASGVEVWFDQNELRGGDAWDAKIRKQIKECTLFLPIISAGTQARPEGYFRLEWRLADQRTHLMGKSKSFLVPVCIDDTRDTEADVPDSFLAVQWTRLRQAYGGQARSDSAADERSLAAFGERVRKLLAGDLGARASSPAPAQSAGETPVVPAGQPRHRRWRPAALIGLGALLALVVWRPWRGANPAASSRSTPVGVPAGTGADVARLYARLVPEAWKKDDFEPWSAEIDRLIARDEGNADAWALRSIINSLQVMRIYDVSTKPLEAGRLAATRAQSLAPDSPLVELALGMHYSAMISRGGDAGVARTHLQRAFAQLPSDPLTRYAELSTANNTFDFPTIGRAAHAWLDSEPSARLPAYFLTLMSLQQRNFADGLKWAERAASENISGARAFVAGVHAHYYLHGDLVAARRALDRIPIDARSMLPVIHASWLQAMAEQRWDLALQELARTPESVLLDSHYYGPKAFLAGSAHQAAGRSDAAVAKFHEAEHILRELLASDGQNERLHAVLAVTLAALGRADEARAELGLVEPLVKGRPRSNYLGHIHLLFAQAHATLGEIEATVAWLRVILSGPAAPAFTPASLRIDPRFQNVIARPELQKLLTEFAHLNAATADETAATSGEKSAMRDKSIAVLAFENRSSEKDSEYFSDGISEELLNVLGRVPGLRVVGRTSSFSFKGKKVGAAEIGRALNVAYLVEGSVQQIGTKARIFAELIKAETGEQVWSEKFNTELEDIFAEQENIAGRIAQNLSLTLGTSPRSASGVDAEAHRLVLEARYYWNSRTDEGIPKADACYRKALALDPRFAEAHAGLALNYGIKANAALWAGQLGVESELENAKAAAREAIRLDPNSANAHAGLGYAFLLAGDFAEAERHFDRALQLGPNIPLTHYWYALMRSTEGRLAEALREFEQSVLLDPLDPAANEVYAVNLSWIDQLTKSSEIAERIVSLTNHGFIPAIALQASNFSRQGRTAEALAAARFVLDHPEMTPRWSSDISAISVLQQLGQSREARQRAPSVMERFAPQSYMRGFIFAALGDFDQAIPCLQHVPAVQGQTLLYSRALDPWRHDPRFQQIIAQTGRVAEYERARKEVATLVGMGAAKK